MTPNWLPIRCDLHDDPAVISIAAAVGCDEFSVVGRLVRLWSWANEQLADGNAPGVTVSWIDRYLSLPGFAMAMVKAGWLTEVQGGVAFPKFDVWNSQGAKRRLLTSKRVQEHRRKGNAKANADGVTPVTQDALPRERERVERKEVPTEPLSATKPPKKSRESKPNPLFDAVAEVTGYDPATAGGLLGSVTAALAKAHPPYTPEDVREFARQFVVLCPYAARDGRTRPEPKELQTHIGKLRSAPPPPTTGPPRPAGGFKTKAEKDRDILAQQMIDSGAFDTTPTYGELT